MLRKVCERANLSLMNFKRYFSRVSNNFRRGFTPNSNERSSAVLSHGTIYLVCTSLVLKVARLIFYRGYLPSLSINYVGMSKDMGKWLPQLYYIKMKMSYDLGFIAIGVAMAP